MGLDNLGNALLRMAVTEPVLKGILTGFVRNITYQQLRDVAIQDKGYQDVPSMWRQTIEHVASNRNLRRSITFEKLALWWAEANPDLFQKVMADPVTATWLRRSWEQGMQEAMRSQEVVARTVERVDSSEGRPGGRDDRPA